MEVKNEIHPKEWIFVLFLLAVLQRCAKGQGFHEAETLRLFCYFSIIIKRLFNSIL